MRSLCFTWSEFARGGSQDPGAREALSPIHRNQRDISHSEPQKQSQRRGTGRLPPLVGKSIVLRTNPNGWRSIWRVSCDQDGFTNNVTGCSTLSGACRRRPSASTDREDIEANKFERLIGLTEGPREGRRQHFRPIIQR